MKKRMLALFLALVMVFGLNTTYLADGDSPNADNTQEIYDFDVEWEYIGNQNQWIVNVERENDLMYTSIKYVVTLCKEDKTEVAKKYDYIWNFPDEEYGEYVGFDFESAIEEAGAGKYYVNFEATVYNSSTGQYELYATGTSAVAEYKLPEKKLDAPKATSENGVITFDMVEGADYYEVEVTEDAYSPTMGIYREITYKIERVYVAGVDSDYIKYATDGKSINFDFAKYFEDYEKEIEAMYEEYGWGTYNRTEHDFTFYVQARPESISEAQASDIIKAGEYSIRFSAEQIADTLKELTSEEALKENPLVARNYLQDLNNDTIIEMMKDASFVNTVKAVEAAMKEAWDLPDVKPESSTNAVEASKISIVGALLNATAREQQMTLTVADAELPELTGYSNAVALDIKLLAGEDELKDLRIPVEITMPIPAGVSTENLVILHYHDGATEPVIITPVASADGKMMTFVVDGFSTFVVANQGASVTSPITGDMFATSMVCAILVLAVGVVVFVKRRSMVK